MAPSARHRGCRLHTHLAINRPTALTSTLSKRSAILSSKASIRSSRPASFGSLGMAES